MILEFEGDSFSIWRSKSIINQGLRNTIFVCEVGLSQGES